MNYFDKIPSIVYNNHTVKNILARARLSDTVKSSKTAFFPYTMAEHDRSDHIANMYYDSPGYTWLVWMSNGTVDPYYDMPLSDDDFVSFIKSKYGSLEAAARKINYYRNNWYLYTEQTISVEAYENLGLTNAKKYYQPVVDEDYRIKWYIRKREDVNASTNKIVTMELTNVNGTFTSGEEVRVNTNNYAFVTAFNSNTLTVQHVTGQFAEGNTITGIDSGSTATVSRAVITAQPISDVEASFWEPVTFFDYERELNERKKQIKLIDVRYKTQIENDLQKIMSTR